MTAWLILTLARGVAVGTPLGGLLAIGFLMTRRHR
jgi:hypothetical protein